VITSHLIELGNRRIAHVTGRRGTVSGEDRLSGYQRAMERAGLPTEGLVLEGAFSRASGASAAAELLDRDVDAIFCSNDAMAEGALGTIRSRGLTVPDDVALAGFDDLAFAAHLDPPLTTIRQGVQRQGEAAAHVLFELLSDPDAGPRRMLLPTELVVRASTIGDEAP
jgi:DNA-binding LacI/PurR family transcriptional regulator